MRLEIDSDRRLQALTLAIARHAAARDADGAHPRQAIAELDALGLLADPPVRAGAMRSLLALLAAAGRGDLSVGRIFEGHVNACWLIEEYGTAAQRKHYREIAGEAGLFGVWNTDAPDDPLRLVGGKLVGRKNFATGVEGMSHAVVTITEDGARRMIVVPTGRPAGRPLLVAAARHAGVGAATSST